MLATDPQRRGFRHSTTGLGAVTLPIPEVDEIHIEDLAHATAQIPRFGGWLTEQFSVAQHGLEGGALCREAMEDTDLPPRLALEAELAGLLHDAHEAIVGDMITPQKRRLGSAWESLEAMAERRTHAALRVTDIMSRHRDVVDWADVEMLVSDILRWGMPGAYVSKHGDFTVDIDMQPPRGHVLRYPRAEVMGWRAVRDAYLERYHHLRSTLDGKSTITQ